MSDALNPSVSLLCKLASVAVHAEEMISSDGHPLDRVALESALADPEVGAWISAMDILALAPKKRAP